MALWSHDVPPIFQPDAVLTKAGWVHPVTNELLVALNDDDNTIGPGTDLRRRNYGTSRIQNTTIKTQQGNSWIRITSLQAQNGLSRIQIVHNTPQIGRSRIEATTQRLQIGRTNIYGTTLRTLDGGSTVQATKNRTMNGVAKIVHRIHLQNLLVEYPFYETPDANVVADLMPLHHNGTLTAAGEWTNLGLRLDGSQQINIPNVVLPPPLTNFTMFAIVQCEIDMNVDTQTNGIFTFGSPNNGMDVWVLAPNGLGVYVQNGGTDGKYFPKANIPFAVVVRYNAAGQIDTRVSEESPVATNIFITDTSNVTPNPLGFQMNGIIGKDFQGTMIYFALFDRLISNGETAQLLNFAHTMLTVRGENLPVPQ